MKNSAIYAIPEIDNYLDAFGTFGSYKSDPDDPAPVERKGRTLKLRDHDFKANKKREERAKRVAKREKTRRIWDDVEDPEGTANRFYLWETFEREDGFHLFIRRQTERHDAVRTRKALAGAEEKIREYA